MPADTPLVSIITPSFNQAEYLRDTIESVLTQRYPNVEYIIVDGGSTDGSVDLIRSYEDRLAGWMSEPDLGQTDAINKGFARASGEILAWLNSDDIYYPGAIEGAVDYLSHHRQIGMVYGNAYYIDEAGDRIGRYPAGETDYWGLRRGVNTIPQQSMFIRSKLWRMIGPLDPTFYYAMDYDLWVRIAELTPIAFQDSYWAGFRLHSSSKSLMEARRCWPEMMRVHFRDGGSRLSVLNFKYILRRIVEPLMPLRLKYFQWKYQLENR
ncbi:MAG: glycosyltransferase family 2 protein [Anaerolineales bacterium]